MFKGYVSTVRVFSDSDFTGMRAGQWVQTIGGARGQFLGVTQSGVVVIRWQPGRFGALRDTRNNRTLRGYARDYGAK
jgi:hypothetical protein